MNRKQLEYFMETYRCRNIQTAANHLYISHQGLSRVIRSLEEELGATLFTRSNRGLEPTDYATALLPHVQTLLDTYSRIDGLYMQERRQKTHVTVYSLDHLMNWLGAEFLLGFHEAWPDVTLSVVDTTDDRALDVLHSGRADFAIVNGPVDSAQFSSEALFFSRYSFRIHRDNPLAEKPRLTAKDLDGQVVVGKGRFSAMKHCGPNSVIRYLDEPDNGQMIYLVERNHTTPTRGGSCFKSFLLDWVRRDVPGSEERGQE